MNSLFKQKAQKLEQKIFRNHSRPSPSSEDPPAPTISSNSGPQHTMSLSSHPTVGPAKIEGESNTLFAFPPTNATSSHNIISPSPLPTAVGIASNKGGLGISSGIIPISTAGIPRNNISVDSKVTSI